MPTRMLHKLLSQSRTASQFVTSSNGNQKTAMSPIKTSDTAVTQLENQDKNEITISSVVEDSKGPTVD
jgi:hypothetical protein